MSQPKAKTVKPTSINVTDFLKTKKLTETKKKSTVPELGGYAHLADKVAEAKVNLQDATAVFGSLEGELITHIRQEYEQAAESGDFSKSFNVLGASSDGVQVTFTDRFSAIPGDMEDTLQKSVTGDQYKTLFEEKRVLTLAKTDDDTIKMLVEKLGEKTFSDIFKINVSIAPKKDMDRNQFKLPAEVRSLLNQAKPGVKLIEGD
jgi:hypothetical protein